MKKLALTLCLTAIASATFAQGLVKFANTSTTLVSANGTTIPSGIAGSYYFGLFTAATGTTDPFAFTFTGTYASNTVAGRLQGGPNLGIGVTGWLAGETKSYFVAGWSATMGHDYKPLWLDELLKQAPGDSGLFGISGIGTTTAGGTDAGGTPWPTPSLFGTAPLISGGFNLTPIPVPEPATMALAGLGAAALLIFRRRN